MCRTFLHLSGRRNGAPVGRCHLADLRLSNANPAHHPLQLLANSRTDYGNVLQLAGSPGDVADCAGKRCQHAIQAHPALLAGSDKPLEGRLQLFHVSHQHSLQVWVVIEQLRGLTAGHFAHELLELPAVVRLQLTGQLRGILHIALHDD